MIKVLVIGAGAIGAFYGSLLAKAGAEVRWFAAPHLESVYALMKLRELWLNYLP